MKVEIRFSGLLYILILFFLASCSPEQFSPRSDNRLLLGTVCVISLDKSEPVELFDQAFDIIAQEEQLMSLQVPDSDLSKVNRSAGVSAVKVSPDTLEVLGAALNYASMSGGAFDPSIAPLVELWGIVTGDAVSPPDPLEIEPVRSLTDYTKVLIDDKSETVFLENKGMKVDLGAIAKGYVGDRVKDFLLSQGVERGIINLGGNIVVIGSKPGNEPWKIGIQNPFDNRGRHIGLVSVSDSTVVTSGIYERFFMYEGKRYHHILDPWTGYPVDNELASVSIIAEKSMDADALSTSLFVLGIDKGLQLIENINGAEAIFVTKEKEIVLSSGAGDFFELKDNGFTIISQR
ncbi:FAD:protein FMN transferase [Spirochaeta isovalerica]|uniref:FAD:protein FMN transferase n=1 Tax=Spirochaeta isovalerica TaxID=150 RepID=A0A841R5M7_9SPIO|nr:FAD:protein FMN transferase [Spirochaeta isovalerica]MBB6478457.1 thiamine biosynthesis lipoprotein [Spirochaeta isovalerica]